MHRHRQSDQRPQQWHQHQHKPQRAPMRMIMSPSKRDLHKNYHGFICCFVLYPLLSKFCWKILNQYKNTLAPHYAKYYTNKIHFYFVLDTKNAPISVLDEVVLYNSAYLKLKTKKKTILNKNSIKLLYNFRSKNMFVLKERDRKRIHLLTNFCDIRGKQNKKKKKENIEK